MVRIITDTTCDIVPEQWQVLGIDVVPLNIEFDDCTYKDRIELSPDDLYEKLSSLDHLPKTSQPAPGAFWISTTNIQKKRSWFFLYRKGCRERIKVRCWQRDL